MHIAPYWKAWVAGIGATLTAVSTCLATVTLAVGDDAISFDEVSAITTAVLALAGTVVAVWRVPNKVN